ncbi:hypothetical protein SNE35_27085 [Paucibacter sp. R3-3]|uniref:Uncharacterized protein n=1 Tax=Roseateles agri TaxID=3098619 RepID=A0ABU5DPE9_9BURK|nr:hypothetical protein [Paucibacter sp. R3-3]MDY0748195.1 hypothetical protein [Paucibacter sp. R3-3]
MKAAFLIKTLCFGLAPVGVALNSDNDPSQQNPAPQASALSAQYAPRQTVPPGAHAASWNVLLAAVHH